MKSFFLRLLPLAGMFCCFVGRTQSALPTHRQKAWADAEIGVLIHYDITLFAKDSFDYKRKETLPPLQNFNPSRLNTDQWVRAAKEGGAKYAVLVVKHGTGFTLWPSKVNPYNVGNTPWRQGKGDILADFIRSCKKYGVSPGLYYNTNYNTYYGAGYSAFADSDARIAYNKAVVQQLTEIWTKYGPLFEIWFDGGVMKDEKGGIASPVAQLIKKYQPQAILFQGPVGNENLVRWVGNEKGRAPYPLWSTADATTSATGTSEINDLNGKPDGRIWCPGEADFPLRKDSAGFGGFMWTKNSENLLLSVDELLESYCTSVGRNANMLVGLVVDTAGLCPKEDAARFKAFHEKLVKTFAKPAGRIHGSGSTIEIDLKRPQKIGYMVLREDIATGEHVRKYSLEAFVDNDWKKVAEGISIGHKRIQHIDAVFAKKFRLRVDEADGPVQISDFSLYATQ